MRHIKNFIHNINDVVLAILIVALAAAIIYWRMQIILDYPKNAVTDQPVAEEAVEEEPVGEPADEEAAAGEDDPEEAGDEADAGEESGDEEAPADETDSESED